MRLSALNSISMNGVAQGTDKKTPKKPFTDNFQDKLINSADMSDCITVPRTIFKGYLSFFAGTTMLTMSSMLKNPVAKKGLSLAGSVASLVGTWFFVRPYVIKNAVPTVDLNKNA